MFSLIIAIISVALVAALALATLYYGGDAYRSSHTKVQAAKLSNQGRQLLAAAELYYVHKGEWPESIPVMVAAGYLSSIPVAQRTALQEAYANEEWQMPGAHQPLFVYDEVGLDVCRQVNENSYGLPGILPKMQVGYMSQCFGPSSSDLRVVVARNLQEQVDSLNDTPFVPENVSSDPIPDATAESDWTVPPGEGSALDAPAPSAVLVLEPADAGDFGAVATYTSVDKVVVVRNDSVASAALGPPALTGDSAFSINQTTCGPTLAPGAFCEVTVRYAPTLVTELPAGTHTTTLAVADGASASLFGSAYNPVSLQSAALPGARVNREYAPVSFSDYLNVSNETLPDLGQVVWGTLGTLPAGMSFDDGLGTLSGTPTTLAPPEGQDFTVVATYKNNQGQQVYTLNVGGAVLQVVQVSAGFGHTCAVLPSGGVKCWGFNTKGQLGDGTLTNKTAPVMVSGLATGVSAVSAGSTHTCAVLANGGAKCWGDNFFGALGDGTSTRRTTPVTVAVVGSDVVSLSAGASHTCAVLTGGAAKCWGNNNYGQLGDGSALKRTSPVPVIGLGAGVARLALGAEHTCAVLNSGTVYCWGRNAQGQLGDGTTTNSLTPVAVSGLGVSAASLALGYLHSCAVLTGGAAKCWGNNNYGQLGDGTTTGSYLPVPVSGLGAGVASLAAGQTHTCAVLPGGAAKCWGINALGELGDGTATSSPLPVPVSGLGPGVASLDAGSSHTCAVLTSGSAMCWGWNNNSQLGDGLTVDKRTPVDVLE